MSKRQALEQTVHVSACTSAHEFLEEVLARPGTKITSPLAQPLWKIERLPTRNGDAADAQHNIRPAADPALTLDDRGETEVLRNRLSAYQGALEEKCEALRCVERRLCDLEHDVFPLLLDYYRAHRRRMEQSSETLTVVFVDLVGFARMTQGQQQGAVGTMRGVVSELLQRYEGKYSNTWGDAIVSGFQQPNGGLKFACHLVSRLQQEGLAVRAGMSHGRVSIGTDPVKGTLNMDGPVLSEGARLEPLARDGEVLVSPQLRYRPEIEEARFLFHPLSRRIRKALGSKEAGESVRCYAVSLREASIP